MSLISEYLCVVEKGQKECQDFLITNRKQIITKLGRQLFKEFIINYRSRYTPLEKDKILRDFRRFIPTKIKKHRSDLAIAYNILKNCHLDRSEQEFLMGFLYERIRNKVPTDLSKLIDTTVIFNIKKQLILDYVRSELFGSPRSLSGRVRKNRITHIFLIVLDKVRLGRRYMENKT